MLVAKWQKDIKVCFYKTKREGTFTSNDKKANEVVVETIKSRTMLLIKGKKVGFHRLKDDKLWCSIVAKVYIFVHTTRNRMK